ncbi:hypothetical protein JR316_0009408 [Psilocybe cubensis]|uniref:Uncharacterized protein n=1 Tax=Psilocybe cubensis TaxID=181762 RepID=A0ACB8GT92_PSICU|nr:hypothetical protein JR316_0009408 [Psilocybe cubensis]KAH9478945.1 hypothetical protein JR316_0009408 [Psilocybe cubensis]
MTLCLGLLVSASPIRLNQRHDATGYKRRQWYVIHGLYTASQPELYGTKIVLSHGAMGRRPTAHVRQMAARDFKCGRSEWTIQRRFNDVIQRRFWLSEAWEDAEAHLNL